MLSGPLAHAETGVIAYYAEPADPCAFTQRGLACTDSSAPTRFVPQPCIQGNRDGVVAGQSQADPKPGGTWRLLVVAHEHRPWLEQASRQNVQPGRCFELYFCALGVCAKKRFQDTTRSTSSEPVRRLSSHGSSSTPIPTRAYRDVGHRGVEHQRQQRLQGHPKRTVRIGKTHAQNDHRGAAQHQGKPVDRRNKIDQRVECAMGQRGKCCLHQRQSADRQQGRRGYTAGPVPRSDRAQHAAIACRCISRARADDQQRKPGQSALSGERAGSVFFCNPDDVAEHWATERVLVALTYGAGTPCAACFVR